MIGIRKAHPTAWRLIVIYALISIALGINFCIFTPTFDVYRIPNPVWGAFFLTIGTSKLVFSTFIRNIRLLRLTMATAIGFILFFGSGTLEPVLTGSGSLQLPILYAGLAALHLHLLFEPLDQGVTTPGRHRLGHTPRRKENRP